MPTSHLRLLLSWQVPRQFLFHSMQLIDRFWNIALMRNFNRHVTADPRDRIAASLFAEPIQETILHRSNEALRGYLSHRRRIGCIADEEPGGFPDQDCVGLGCCLEPCR